MLKNIYHYGPLFCLLILIGCKDPYGPPKRSVNTDYLVVEGYLNGNGFTTVRLSRTFKLDDTARIKPELLATVSVEGKSGNVFSFSSAGNGIYETNNLFLNTNDQYRLHIRTVNNKEYVSEYVEYKPTPAIDSLNWTRQEQGVNIFVNTHDPSDKTRYYHWDYDETWEFHSPFNSIYEYKNGQIVSRNMNINIAKCWQSSSSNNIILGSSAKLQKDVISLSPITIIPNNSWKLSVRYSVNVKQYALTEKAYQYWQNMLKNSEKIGTIFDSQPSEIRGNIYSITDADELVVGFISAGTIREKRLFIGRSEVPGWRVNSTCELMSTPDNKDSIEHFFGSNEYIPIDIDFSPPRPMRWLFSTSICVDCRLRGTNVKPWFW